MKITYTIQSEPLSDFLPSFGTFEVGDFDGNIDVATVSEKIAAELAGEKGFRVQVELFGDDGRRVINGRINHGQIMVTRC